MNTVRIDEGPADRFGTGAVPVDPALMARLVPLIRERLGIVIQPHQQPDLAASVAETARHFGYRSPQALAERFATLDEAAPEMIRLVSRITIGESFFFRDAAQFDFLRKTFLPALVKERMSSSRTLRVWSAAASQGQELYSVAMLLHDILPDLPRWNLHLLGTDINTEALATAMEGLYREWSLRGADTALRARHFLAEPQALRVRPELRAMTRFAYLNLASETYPSVLTDTHSMDLILCRNVFIYFDDAQVRRVLGRLVQSLAPGGVLLLGASDLVNAQVDGLEAVTAEGMVYYRKPVPAPRQEPAASGQQKAAPQPALLAQLRELAAARQWAALIARAEMAGAAGAAHIDTLAEALLLQASAYGNLGRHAQALERCQRALQLAPTDKQAHFLHGLLLQEAGNAGEAMAALRRALFLDASFLEAHYQLGILLMAQGQRDKGRKSLHNALTLVRRCDPARRLHGDPDLDMASLIEILRNDLQLLEGLHE